MTLNRKYQALQEKAVLIHTATIHPYTVETYEFLEVKYQVTIANNLPTNIVQL